MQLVIVTPVFQDWESFQRLLAELDLEFKAARQLDPIRWSVVAVDDGSIDEGPSNSPQWAGLDRIEAIKVVRMAVNMGHQRAIALGLVEVVASGSADAVVVMDADGEDRPSDVLRLVEAWMKDPGKIILAQRSRRSESVAFRLAYKLYRSTFRVLTGQSLPFGNFCLLPRAAVERFVWNSDIWNHLAAAIGRGQHPVTMLSTSRGRRYAGRGHMNWVALVIHGLSAMSVHSDRVAARLIAASSLVMAGSLFAALCAAGTRLFTDFAIPGWASQVVGTFLLASLISVGFATLLAFITLQARQRATFIPKVDGRRYIRGVESWLPAQAETTSARN